MNIAKCFHNTLISSNLLPNPILGSRLIRTLPFVIVLVLAAGTTSCERDAVAPDSQPAVMRGMLFNGTL